MSSIICNLIMLFVDVLPLKRVEEKVGKITFSPQLYARIG